MNKVLFTATIDDHILSFHIPYLKWFKEQGFEVHVASNGNSDIPYVDVKHNIAFNRSPFSLKNLTVFKELKKVIAQNHFQIVHCHTPMGGVITRLAAKEKRKCGAKIIYTAHGFHFYKKAPLINWILYYPIEKWLAKYTDCLITINEEDYQKISKSFDVQYIKLVNGVGIDFKKFVPQTEEMKTILRKEYHFNESDFILLFAGELNYTKHQDLLIDVIYLLKEKIPNIKLLLAGDGVLLEKYKEQINRLNLQSFIQFLGYRQDVKELMLIADISVSSSRREGLPVNVVEAMATGLPLVVTNCRGNKDLVVNGENGYVIEIEDRENYANAIEKIYHSPILRKKFRKNNLAFVEKYSLQNVQEEMAKIYSRLIEDGENSEIRYLVNWQERR